MKFDVIINKMTQKTNGSKTVLNENVSPKIAKISNYINLKVVHVHNIHKSFFEGKAKDIC
jgi:hypothetical protein